MDMNPGLIPSPLDQRDAQYDAVFPLGGDVRDSRDWSSKMPPYRNQGWIPSCTAFATRAVKFALDGGLVSAIYLFFKSGGWRSGNYAHAPAAEMKDNGTLDERFKPYPNPNDYSYDTWEQLKQDSLQASAEAVEDGKRHRLASYSFVPMSSAQAVVDALEHSPLALAVPIHQGYFTATEGWTPRENPAWHLVCLVQRKADGTLKIFDSLGQSANFDGFHELPPDYPVGVAVSVRDLPDDWKETQKTWLERQFPNAYVQYGKPRLPLAEEQRMATKLRSLVESYPDTGIRSIAARYWIVLVNAYLYGGFSATVIGPDGKEYFAYREHGSDLANCLYHYRRHGTFPLDLDKLRSEK